jgi:hypothetical protein
MTTTLTRTGRSLITPALFDVLVHRVGDDDELHHALAERIIDQALAFLAACARNTTAPLAPSELVDVGWHTFLLHTRDYAAFCHEIAGRFLHHVPTTPNDPAGSGSAARDTLIRTIAAIDDAGFVVDPDLWPLAKVSSCTGCHNGCHDDPPPAHR